MDTLTPRVMMIFEKLPEKPRRYLCLSAFKLRNQLLIHAEDGVPFYHDGLEVAIDLPEKEALRYAKDLREFLGDWLNSEITKN